MKNNSRKPLPPGEYTRTIAKVTLGKRGKVTLTWRVFNQRARVKQVIRGAN